MAETLKPPRVMTLKSAAAMMRRETQTAITLVRIATLTVQVGIVLVGLIVIKS